MPGITNVVLRAGVYHFRRMVPRDLRPHIGRAELVRTLATRDPRTAKVRSFELYICSEKLFLALRAPSMMTNDQLARLVQDFYSYVLDRENGLRLSGAPLPDEARARRAAFYGTVAAKSRDALACNRLADAAFVTLGMLRKQGITPSELSTLEHAQAQQAMLRAGVDLAEAVKARYEGDFNYEPRDRLLKVKLDLLTDSPPVTGGQNSSATSASVSTAQSEAAPSPPQDLVLSVVGTDFRETQTATRAWDQQTSSQARATYRLFVEVCGDRPLAAYARRDVGLFRERIQRLPNDYGKNPRYRDLSVDQILATYATLPAASRTAAITQKTVKRHFSALSALWSNAVSGGHAAENIFVGFHFAATKKATDQRAMWEQDELLRLFATPVWRGCESAARRSRQGSVLIRDEKYWLPLIAVFFGLRQEEICQLQLEDVREKDGIFYLDINNRPPRKLKNTTAVRLVPIHDELVRIGLLEYVDAQRLAGHSQLFPALRPGGADGRLGHSFTKWFTRYRREVGLYRRGLDFHSFRHTATTQMHQGGVERAVIDHVTGHTTPGETARYTKRSSLTQLRTAINTISIGVELSPAGMDLKGKAAGVREVGRSIPARRRGGRRERS